METKEGNTYSPPLRTARSKGQRIPQMLKKIALRFLFF